MRFVVDVEPVEGIEAAEIRDSLAELARCYGRATVCDFIDLPERVAFVNPPPGSLPPPLTIHPSIVDMMFDAGRAAAPMEACGVLWHSNTDPAWLVSTLTRVPNVGTVGRFMLDETAYADALRSGMSAGMEVAGFWHTHPSSDPMPSPEDVAGHSEPGHPMVIVSCAGDRPAVRAWQIVKDAWDAADGAVAEITVNVG